MENRVTPVLILLGALISGYLALYQLGVFARPWDPIFGLNSEKVLHSSLSRKLPIPDALLGFAAYTFELLLAGLIAFTTLGMRYWPELLLGVVSFLMALGGIFLTLAQVFIVHAGCTLCLCSALISVVIFGLTIPEVTRAFHSTREGFKKGLTLWQAVNQEDFDARI